MRKKKKVPYLRHIWHWTAKRGLQCLRRGCEYQKPEPRKHLFSAQRSRTRLSNICRKRNA